MGVVPRTLWILLALTSLTACGGARDDAGGGSVGGAAGVGNPGGAGGIGGIGGAAGVGGVAGVGGAAGMGGEFAGSGGVGVVESDAGGVAGIGGAAGSGGDVGGSGGAAGVAGMAGEGGAGGNTRPLIDPGTGAWVPVPAERVLEECNLDPALLAAADSALHTPWAIVRYGKLCHEYMSANFLPAEAWSTTKTLGALVTGAVAYQTKGIVDSGFGTGPFSDEDRVDHWISSFSYNRDAHVAHVLAMVAHNGSLALGQKTMSYDTVGNVQINTLSDMLNVAIKQDTSRLGNDLEAFTQRFLFGPLGIRDSTWSNGMPDKVFAFGWKTNVRDMARIGLLMLNKGMWSGQRIVDAEWIDRMTHPAFEDGNTGYGYLTWLNASSNHHFGGIPGAPVGLQQAPQSPGPCAPVAVARSFPHGLSDSPNCNYASPQSCDKALDVGVWQAVGLNGQVIQGHPGLDLVIVARDVTPFGSGPDAPRIVWDAVRDAIIATDPKHHGDETAFCADYGANTYAPDLR